MTAPLDEGQELRTESARLRAELREHLVHLASVVSELRDVADVKSVQQAAAQPRTTGAADHARQP